MRLSACLWWFGWAVRTGLWVSVTYSLAQPPVQWVLKCDPGAGLVNHEFRFAVEHRYTSFSDLLPRRKPPKLPIYFGFELDELARPPDTVPKYPRQPLDSLYQELNWFRQLVNSRNYPTFIYAAGSIYYHENRWGPVYRIGLRLYGLPRAPEGPFVYAGLRAGLWHQWAPADRRATRLNAGFTFATGWQQCFGHHRVAIAEAVFGVEAFVPAEFGFFFALGLGLAIRYTHGGIETP